MKTLYTVYTRERLEGACPVTNKGRFQDAEQAEALAEIIRNSGNYASVGLFYVFTREEFNRDPYRDRLPDAWGVVRDCTIIKSALNYRNIHFEVIGD